MLYIITHIYMVTRKYYFSYIIVVHIWIMHFRSFFHYFRASIKYCYDVYWVTTLPQPIYNKILYNKFTSSKHNLNNMKNFWNIDPQQNFSPKSNLVVLVLLFHCKQATFICPQLMYRHITFIYAFIWCIIFLVTFYNFIIVMLLLYFPWNQ